MDDERWDVFLIPLSETGEEALSYAEARELTQDMSADEYAREMECSFDAPVEGAYFAEALNALAAQGRVCQVPVDLAAPVMTAWDLGVHDYCSIWWWQNVGREVHFVDYADGGRQGPRPLGAGHAREEGLRAASTTTATSCRTTSRRAKSPPPSRDAPPCSELIPHDEPIITVPRIRSKEDGIHAARAMLGSAFFDADKCKIGLAMLRGYHKSQDGPAGAWARARTRTAPTPSRPPPSASTWSPASRPRCSGAAPMRRKIRGIV